MLATVNSVNDVPIRLTEERWAHILEGHGELANMQGQILDTVAKPDRILAGGTGELLAIKGLIVFNVGLWYTIKRQGSVFSPKLFVNAP
jgi:hypothetical protein